MNFSLKLTIDDSVLFHVCFSLSLHFFHGNDADAGDVGAQLLRQRGGYGGYQMCIRDSR